MYIGVTSDLAKRTWEHQNDVVKGFTSRYGVHTLVHLEEFDSMPEAILREKQLKKWRRNWKLKLTESGNPTWRDLYDDFMC